MLPNFVVLKGLFKLDSVKIDTTLFRLHYKLTVIFLAASCILVSIKQYVGDPIDCMISGGPDQLKGKVLDTYCWINSTFTMVDHKDSVYYQQRLHNLGPISQDSATHNHTYYQWVGFVLLFQTVLFYLPRLIWKTCEGGRMRELVDGLTSPIAHKPHPSFTENGNDSGSPLPGKRIQLLNNSNENQERLVDYLIANFGHHNLYAACFFLCEALNLLNVSTQVYFMDIFFGGELRNLTTDTILSTSDQISPLSKFFPRVSKCLFSDYGPGATIQTFDALCVLPINIINEKIYIFLWLWCTSLAVLSLLGITYRLAVISSPRFRSWLFHMRYIREANDQVDLVMGNCHIGDWFLLRLIGENVNSWVFQDVLDNLGNRLDHSSQVSLLPAKNAV